MSDKLFHLRIISIFLSSSAEQTVISKVLSEMDTEISVLENKQTKVRSLKWGMMQKLLTGRIRLV